MRQSNTVLGTVVEIKTMGHGLKQMAVKLENGKFELYFEEFKDTYNKSLKVGDQVKVSYKFSNWMDCNMSKKPTKVKNTGLKLVS